MGGFSGGLVGFVAQSLFVPCNFFDKRGSAPLPRGGWGELGSGVQPVTLVALTCSRVNYDRILYTKGRSEAHFSKILSSFDNTLTLCSYLIVSRPSMNGGSRYNSGFLGITDRSM